MLLFFVVALFSCNEEEETKNIQDPEPVDVVENVI